MPPPFQRHVFICTNERPETNPKGSCAAKGSVKVLEKLKEQLYQRGMRQAVRANKAGCLDACAHGCSMVIYPDAVWYGRVTPDDVEEIVERHLLKGEVVERLRMPMLKKDFPEPPTASEKE